MNKPKRGSFSLRTINIICIVIFVLSSFLLYCISDDSKVRVLSSEGNYFYTDQQIYDQAHISLNTRMWLFPEALMEKQISNLNLIEDVEVKKSENRLVIQIKEKMPISYYIEDSKYYVLTIDNEPVEIDSEYKSNLIHLPFISELSKSQRKEMCNELKKDEKNITHDLIEKISQIVPFQSSYDDNMIRLIMRDGNSVYTSMDSLKMLSKYSLVLTQLKGNSACLLLDAAHNAIDKIDCSDITTNRKELVEKINACVQDGGHWDEEDNECSYQDEKENETGIDEDSESEEVPDSSFAYLDSIADWTYDENSGWYISPSTGYYKSPYTNEYYMWDNQSISFVLLEKDPQ